MADPVVDASVVTKWYIPERDHEPARLLRDGYLSGDYDLLAPSLLPFEVVNALMFSGHYDGDALQEASGSLTDYGLSLLPYRELGPVAEIANDLDLTVYDAAYVALADTRGSIVYTADSRLLDDLEGSEYADLAAHIRSFGS